MSKVQKHRIIALSGICLLALMEAARAQGAGGAKSTAPETTAPVTSAGQTLGAITLGVGGLSQGSDAYGRYNGMTKPGVGAFASWYWNTRDPWDSGGTRFFSFSGDNFNVGLGGFAPEASASLKAGDQGLWDIAVSYDGMSYAATSNFTTILGKDGALTQGYQNALTGANMYFKNVTTVPSTLFGAFNASTGLSTSNPITTFGPSNEVVDRIGTRRDKASVDGNYYIGDWVLTSGVSREHKEGTLEQAMTTGGNNAGMVTFPMPINYDTDLYTAAGAYLGESLQAKISYKFSNFIDNNSAGYAYQGWNFGAYKSPAPVTYTSYAKSGDYSLPPSNQAHTFSGELGYTFDDTTRLYSTAVYGLQIQNAPFVPATNLGYFALPVAAPLAAQLGSNPTSLNGWVETFFGNMTVTSRPLTDLDLKATYTIDSRNPHTSAKWIYGDPTDTTALKYREAVPEGWTKNELSLTAGYHVLSETRITAGYKFTQMHRSNAITHDTQDSEGSVGVHSMLPDDFTGTLNYVHAERTASTPDWTLWTVQIPSDCGSTVAALGCQQVPFYEAARTQDTVSGSVNGTLWDNLSTSLIAKYNANTYHGDPAIFNGVVSPSVGLNRDYSVQAGPDVNYRIDNNAELHFYYSFQRYYRALRSLNGNATGLREYAVASTYDIHTAGLGGTWQYDDKTKLVGDYTLSYGGEAFAQSGAWNTGFPGDPNLSTKSVNNQVKVHADYEYSARTSLYLGYEFDSLDTSDWALVGASLGQVLTGDVPAKYNVSKIIAGATVKF